MSLCTCLVATAFKNRPLRSRPGIRRSNPHSAQPVEGGRPNVLTSNACPHLLQLGCSRGKELRQLHQDLGVPTQERLAVRDVSCKEGLREPVVRKEALPERRGAWQPCFAPTWLRPMLTVPGGLLPTHWFSDLLHEFVSRSSSFTIRRGLSTRHLQSRGQDSMSVFFNGPRNRAKRRSQFVQAWRTNLNQNHGPKSAKTGGLQSVTA